MPQYSPFLHPEHLLTEYPLPSPCTLTSGETEDMLPETRRFPVQMRGARLLPRAPRPSVCVALFRPGTSGTDVLLHLRADNGLWGLPGGALEYGESLEEAVRREMHEETGLTDFEVRGLVNVHSDPATGACFTYPDGQTVHYVCITVLAWMADWDASATHLRASAESLALYWFPLESCPTSLPAPFAPVHQTRLAAAWTCLHQEGPLLALG